MKPNEIADRLEALRFNPRHHIGAGDIRLTLDQQDEILAALRDADEKATRLPSAVKLSIDSGDTLIVEQGMDGGHTVGVYVASLATGGEYATADTPEAAIDKLAAALEKENP